MTTTKHPTHDKYDAELLERFAATTRDTDIFVPTAAASGQTWLLTLLYHLKTRGLQPEFQGRGLLGVTPLLHIARGPEERENLQKKMVALDDPRIFKMHVNWEQIPRPPASLARVITVTRDLREMPYSLYRHFLALEKHPPWFRGDFDEYFEQWMESKIAFDFIRSFWPHRNDHDVLWHRYSDMKADLRGETERILAFLNWELSDTEISRVLELVDFRYMRSDQHLLGAKGKSAFREGENFFREGCVGKNRARLSDEQERRVVDRARAQFSPDCFAFVMTLGD